MNRAAQILERLEATTKIATEVLQEIARVTEAGLTDEVCDALDDGALANAAGCYLVFTQAEPPPQWPLAPELWKPTDTRADFVKALALYLLAIAVIDRRQGW